MASQIPDPRTLNSWEDAFQYPLPVVRKLEQQLRNNIDDNRQKLRSLVGASYRDLLGTAERIIEMDDQVQTVETHLGDIGQRCNARTIEKLSENQSRMRRTRDAQTSDSRRSMAQMKVLKSCLTAATRILKAGGDALQASKLFVLCRLLFKNLSEASDASNLLQDMQRKLNNLRSRLLSFIERTLVRLTPDKGKLEHALYAYTLATSSSSKEVLRHFMQIRYDHLDRRPELPKESDVLRMLDIYGDTLLDVRELFPRRFADGLSQLAKVPLLQDAQIKSITELNIDIYGAWIDEHVRTFIPWIRHDQITGSEIADVLGSWAKQSQLGLLSAVRAHTQTQDEARVVLNSRNMFISKFISLSGKLKSATSVDAIHELRKAYLSRLEELASRSALVADLSIDEHRASNVSNSDTSDLWDLATQDKDLKHGALQLRQSLLRKRHGRSASIQEGIEKLETWLKRVSSVLDIIDEMIATKWDQDLEYDLDELEDDGSLQQLLSKHDPQKLKESLRDACQKSLNDSIDKLNEAAASSALSMYSLRIWREIDLRRRSLDSRLSVSIKDISFVELQRNIASSITGQVIHDYIRTTKTHREPAVTLWDGTPAIPTQPSPPIFRFLTALHHEMSHAGADLWTPQSVFELKIVVLETLSRDLEDSPSKGSLIESGLTNGHLEIEDDSESEGERKNEIEVNGEADGQAVSSAQRIQRLFDMLYLARVFTTSWDDVKSSSFGSVVEASQQATQLDDASLDRLRKNVGDYWKRTYLLYGLLASNGSMGRH